ncbi:hypothetical protein BDV30DRAFT_210044 [Aspergillus minisclerotigenes]|uniref:Uncharacterized protein n=1 Tax=Aspergillus minisclerotigenes TaxID=656917 RepID=A0A5N6J520_9EURO|nr:hypothetical protein BDV30DRAFT_210044 [Aspergillus minisclerotigenes]
MATNTITFGPGSMHGPHLGFPSRSGPGPDTIGLPMSPTIPIRPGNGFINVLNKINQQVGVSRSPAKFYLAIKSLSASDTATLTSQFPNLKHLSEDEKGEFSTKVSQALSSDEGRATLEDAALAAARACKDIKHQFIELRLALRTVGNAGPSNQARIQGFQKALTEREDEYDGVIGKCKRLSMQIGVYSEQFQSSLMPYVQAPIEIDKKEEFINKYIEKTKEFGDESKKIEEELDKLLSNFRNLMTDFLDFSNDQQPDLASSIQQIENKIQDLNNRLTTLKSQLTAMNIGRGVIGPVATALATLFPPASVFILAAGLVGVGALSVSAACVGAEIETVEEEKISLEKEIETLKRANNIYTESTARLKELSNAADFKFSVSVELIKDVLKNLTVDTEAIARWLKDGGDALAVPTLAENSFNKSGAIYKELAGYLMTFSRNL